MAQRLRTLFLKLWSIPGWVFIGWGMLTVISNTQLLFRLVQCAFGYLDKHPLVVVLIGFAWVFGVAAWPSVKPRLAPLINFPRSLHQRIGDTEASHVALDQRVKALERLPGILPAFTIDLIGLSGLLAESATAIETFERLRAMHDKCPAYLAPFSAWRPPPGTSLDDPSLDNAIRDWEKLARFLERYVRVANKFFITSTWAFPIFASGELFTIISTWRFSSHDMPGESLLMLLREHQSDLSKIRDESPERLSVALVARQ